MSNDPHEDAYNDTGDQRPEGFGPGSGEGVIVWAGLALLVVIVIAVVAL